MEYASSSRPNRIFDPKRIDYYVDHPSDIISKCDDCNSLNLLDDDGCTTLVASFDGACRGNGTPDARASYGVNFGSPDNNRAGLIPQGLPQTNQVAELYALKICLEQIDSLIEQRDRMPCQILLMSDSTYVVKGLSEWIWKWKENGFLTAKKQMVVNMKLFSESDELISISEEVNTPSKFWLVPRKWNKEADRLANMALDGVSIGSA